MMMMLRRTKHVHFTAIGGIGMSGLAEMLLNLGYTVSGSDLALSPLTRRLETLGARISSGHRAENIAGADVVVWSSAVAPDNPELVAARAAGIPLIPRAELLHELMRTKYGVAIAGTHGKTTTTSMTAFLLQRAGLDPTAVIGGRVSYFGGSNARLGQGDYFVAEADESDGSFLKLAPTLAVVTNIDNDHLNHFGTMDNLRQAFVDFINRVPFYGLAILCLDDPNVVSILPRVEKKYVTYGIGSPAAVLTADGLRADGLTTTFTVRQHGKRLGEVTLRVPGEHNVRNALAALAVGLELEVPFATLAAALDRFEGVQRRFQPKGTAAGVMVIDDYGHHPSEVAATLAGARAGWPGPLWVVFQPHRYTRTQELYREFGGAFGAADRIFLLDIYPASEAPIPGVTSRLIADELVRRGKAVELADKETIAAQLEPRLAPGTMLLTLGAGDVYRCGEELVRLLQARAAGKRKNGD